LLEEHPVVKEINHSASIGQQAAGTLNKNEKEYIVIILYIPLV